MPANAIRKPLLFCALAAALLLPGCSTLQIAYNFAGDMLESRAEDYLDLSPEQEAELEKQSAALIQWHRKAMLPKYAAFFTAQAEIAEAGGWSREQMKDTVAGFRALMDETVAGAAPFVAEVLAGHTTPEKLAYLEARMAENTAERRAEEAAETREESIDEWVERRVERIERFTGPLTDAQEAIVRQHTETGYDRAQRWLDNRELRQGALVTFLRQAPSKDEIAGFVHRILLHAHEIVDPAYREVSEARWALQERMYHDVLAALNDEQRRELAASLRSYAADMTDLAGV